jgi:hypothetical protein
MYKQLDKKIKDYIKINDLKKKVYYVLCIRKLYKYCEVKLYKVPKAKISFEQKKEIFYHFFFLNAQFNISTDIISQKKYIYMKFLV